MTWRMVAAAGLVFVCGLASGEASAQSPKTISVVAAYYSKDYQGTTASGELYDPNKFTCAHPTLPFGTRVLVTDPRSRRSVVVTRQRPRTVQQRPHYRFVTCRRRGAAHDRPRADESDGGSGVARRVTTAAIPPVN